MNDIRPLKFNDRAKLGAPFQSDPRYDAKPWELCLAKCALGRVLNRNIAPLGS